jgi:hypothetical protein
MVDPAGKIANKNGKWLEATIANQLKMAGYIELSKDEKTKFIKEDGSILAIDKDKWFVQQVAMHRNLYDSKWKVDFFVFNHEKYPEGFYIESKYQGTPGSIDEKYVFTILSMKELPVDSAIVFDGTGARLGAIRWIKNQCSKRSKVKFFTLSEFLVWARDHI